MIQTDKIQGILNTIEGKTAGDLQSPLLCQEYLVQLTSWLAFTSEQQALTGKAYNIAKRDAYTKLQKDYQEKSINLSPSLAKDYIASMCSKEAFAYELAERASRCIVHVLDATRSILSSMKSEMANLRYNTV